jgi:hypothetical protein
VGGRVVATEVFADEELERPREFSEIGHTKRQRHPDAVGQAHDEFATGAVTALRQAAGA